MAQSTGVARPGCDGGDCADVGRARVAVVGSGVAGLTAAYLLQQRYDVVLFEADDRLGGHAHTHDVMAPDGRALAVDSGFIVHNERTYPNLIRLFGRLGVATQDTEMSMSVRCEGCGLEYAGARGLHGMLARPSSAVRPEYLRMLLHVKRFHREARRILDGARADSDADYGTDADIDYGTGGGDVAGGRGGAAGPSQTSQVATLQDFLREGRYPRYFADHFMLPLVSAVWSAGRGTALRYPARYLFRFLEHHGMLSVTGSPQWRTVVGGSRTYVERAAKELSAVFVSTPVRAVYRHADGVRVRDDADALHTVDRVVIATHPDQALRLLADPTPAERAVLGAIPYSRSEAVLHTDASVLPRSGAAVASWNYLLEDCGPGARRPAGGAVVTYHMNRLHRLDEPTPYLVTLNATPRIRLEAVVQRMVYEHPVYTPQSLAAQRTLPALTTARTAYAGAYHGWGFHEDGCASGVAAAEAFGAAW
jgi:predicted NAD/FAD-binding protein